MPSPEQQRWRAVAKELYVGITGWAWIVASLLTVYFVIKAFFFKPIIEQPLDFLNRLNLVDQFAQLTSLSGPISIKAVSIGFLLSKYPGVTDPRVNCIASVGATIFQIIEDVPTVRARVDAIRTQAES